MRASPSYPLTNIQKWKLGFGLAIIYVPLRIYMNVSFMDQHIFVNKLPLWGIELLVSILFYTFWINVIEWLQQYFHDFFGEIFLSEFKFLNQFTILVIAIGLAVMFNYGFRHLWHWMELILDPQAVKDNTVLDEKQFLFILEFKRRANTSITVMALMAAFYLASNRRVYERLQEAHSNSERLEKENVKAQFSALKNQVSPHFLFNNFSVLSSLVETNPALSVEFIRRLSKAYRYILEQSGFDHIKLRTEIEFLETYTFLLKTRFEEKIRILTDLTESDKDKFSIVPLTLQLLVENAVKHNQMSSQCPLIVTIRIEDDKLVVSNPLQLRPLTEPSTGLGLQNIINRYKLLTNQPVWAGEKESQFVVKMPLIS